MTATRTRLIGTRRLSTTGPRTAAWRRSRTGLGMLLVGALTTSGMAALLTAGAAAAAVPTFPDNLLVFPNRDFITVEGYQAHIGQTATVEVTRAGVGVVGSAQGVVSGGDVAFEINHPGGYCWGAGTGLNVTPDIQPGDIASIRFGTTAAGDTTVQDAYVSVDASQETTTLTGDTVIVRGHIGPNVIQDQTEQRIIEPALTDTAIGRRDVRAIPGPMTPAPKGGYSSALAFNDVARTFTATYIFDDPAVAEIAANAGLGERLLSWEVVDTDANRQGITIAEFGEPGGPGMGGCPNGPLQSGPPGPTSVTAANVAGGVRLTWTPAVAIPGTPAITGYRATAIAQTASPSGERVEIGRRIIGQAATGTTITGLSPAETYDIEVVATSSVGSTFPAVTAVPQTDITAPTVSASPAGGSFAVPQQVTLTANESGSQIFFTTDGTDPVDATGLVSPTATHFTAPFTVSTNTTVRFVAFDPTGNVSLTGMQTFTITDTPVPATPVFTLSSAGAGSVTLSWTGSDPSITGYAVQVYDGAGTAKIGALRLASPATATTMTITDLPTDVAYRFTVVATNANGSSPESSMVGPLTPLGAVVANAGPDQTVIRKTTATNVTLNGAGSTPGATYRWNQVLTGPADPDMVTLTGSTTLSPSFTLALFRHPMTNKPLTFRLTVTAGTNVRTDDVLVTPKADQVSITTSRWKTGDFRVSGAGSVVGSTITIHRGSLAGPVLGQAPVTTAAPATGGVFDLRLRNAAAPTTNPVTIWIESTVGGSAGPFTVQ
jgi:Chitobiase/beta-hexosaminidase C-terminal domain/Fibronectin type III domain